MRFIYSFILTLLMPLIILRLFYKSRKLNAYRKRISERFFGVGWQKNIDVWLHAVSLGEVNAASGLVEKLLDQNKAILITTMTPTGSAQVTKLFGQSVVHQYLPYDLRVLMKRFLKVHKPKVGVILETEIWPNLISQAYKEKIPLLLFNGRISDKSWPKYYAIKFFLKPLLDRFDLIVAQSKSDAERFLKLGSQNRKLRILNNLKLTQMQKIDNPYVHMKQNWGSKKVIILASTHKDEEKLLLDNLDILTISLKDYIILIAPRHPERFNEVFELAKCYSEFVQLKSKFNGEKCDILIIDSLGELALFYDLADVVFLGGSLVNIGGHNLLEPLALQKPVVVGPFLQNVKDLSRQLQDNHAIIVCQDPKEVMSKIVLLETNPQFKAHLINNAQKFYDSLGNNLAEYISILEEYF